MAQFSVGANKCGQLHIGKRFNLALLAIGAAVAGDGVAIGRSALLMDELESGALVAPFPVAVRSEASYHFITTPEHSVQVDMIGDWVRSEGAQFSERRSASFTRLGIESRG